jgi:transposase
VTTPEPLRTQLRTLTRGRLLDRCARLRPKPSDAVELRAGKLALRSCARRVRRATEEARELEREIERLIRQLASPLLAEPGIGPISAAQVLLAWSHRGRLRNEAAFARLAGAAPIPASSGKTIRYRLDRGGDRQLNRALHTIALARRKHHPATIAYIARRTSEGKTPRETIRCLKRYLARHLFRTLEAMPTAT